MKLTEKYVKFTSLLNLMASGDNKVSDFITECDRQSLFKMLDEETDKMWNEIEEKVETFDNIKNSCDKVIEESKIQFPENKKETRNALTHLKKRKGLYGVQQDSYYKIAKDAKVGYDSVRKYALGFELTLPTCQKIEASIVRLGLLAKQMPSAAE